MKTLTYIAFRITTDKALNTFGFMITSFGAATIKYTESIVKMTAFMYNILLYYILFCAIEQIEYLCMSHSEDHAENKSLAVEMEAANVK